MNNAKGRPKKKKIISRQRAYHGVTIATASLTGLPWVHTDFDLPIANILHTSCPHYYRYGEAGENEDQFADRMAKDLDDLIQKRRPGNRRRLHRRADHGRGRRHHSAGKLFSQDQRGARASTMCASSPMK